MFKFLKKAVSFVKDVVKNTVKTVINTLKDILKNVFGIAILVSATVGLTSVYTALGVTAFAPSFVNPALFAPVLATATILTLTKAMEFQLQIERKY